MRLLSKDLEKRLEEKQLSVRLSDEAVEYIVEKGYDPIYGARPLKRYMQHTLETMLAKKILAGGFSAHDKLTIGVNANGLTVEKE